ncbi:unnamed protein product [Microthlaspi erraticum]|uniref:Uncharacterized protein n=1 Tax=Microthlaspi erraticum TaxID=1685480 RepID=A0A6D2JEZ8_9BRAS|nr:unnamed protein product [Microthlaspi erraticum]
MMPMVSCDHTYEVRVHSFTPSSGEGLTGCYRVRVWRENLEMTRQETNWVIADFGSGDAIFDESFTFHHHSSISKLILSLEMYKPPPMQIELMNNPPTQEVGTGPVTLPTEVLKPIEVNVPIFDTDELEKGSIYVILEKTN